MRGPGRQVLALPLHYVERRFRRVPCDRTQRIMAVAVGPVGGHGGFRARAEDRRAARSQEHAARRLQRPAGPQRLSADDLTSGRPLHRLYRPPRRHARRAQADQHADRPGRVQRHLDPRRHRSGASEISRSTFPAQPGQLRRRRRADDARLRRQRRCRRAIRASSICCASSAGSAHEIWDVTDPANPALLTRIGGLKDTHKSWWECDTGIAYLVSGAPGWRARRMTQVYDLSDPAHPVKIRDFGLAGQEPGATGTVPTELHGMISTRAAGNRDLFRLRHQQRRHAADRRPREAAERAEGADAGKPALSGSRPARDVAAASARTRRFRWCRCRSRNSRKRQGRRGARHRHDRRRGAGQRMPGAKRGRWCGSSISRRDASRWWCRTSRCRKRAAISASAAAASARIPRTRAWRRCSTRSSPSSPGSMPACARIDIRDPYRAEGGRLFHPGDHRGDRQALHQGRRQGPLQGRDPEQQCRDRRPRLHLCGRSRQYRPAHPRADRRGAQRSRDCRRSTPLDPAKALPAGRQLP